MGLVLDSSVLIAAERDARPVSELLATLEKVHGETEIVLSFHYRDRAGARSAPCQHGGTGPESARVPGHRFCGDSGGAVQ